MSAYFVAVIGAILWYWELLIAFFGPLFMFWSN